MGSLVRAGESAVASARVGEGAGGFAGTCRIVSLLTVRPGDTGGSDYSGRVATATNGITLALMLGSLIAQVATGNDQKVN